MEETSGVLEERPLHLKEHCNLDLLSQEQSLFFSKLPAELRDDVYRFALSDYEDIEEAYSDDTCYKRPGYLAKRRTDTALLRACQRIYLEAWHIPWIVKEHTVYLTSHDRKPEGSQPEDLTTKLSMVYQAHGESATEMGHLRIFAQLYNLEPGTKLQSLLDIPHLNIKCITITIRHTDFWFWERDAPIYIRSDFVKRCRLPDSVTELRMELESLERRQPQIEEIAQKMRSSWAFRRHDGKLLIVNQGSQDEVMRWEGSSTWNDNRWLRDETKPDTLEYYVQIVRFKVSSNPAAEDYTSPTLHAKGFRMHFTPPATVSVWRQLQPRGIGRGHTAQEVRDLLNRYRHSCPCNRNTNDRRCCGTGLGAGWLDQTSSSPRCANCQVSCESPPLPGTGLPEETFGLFQ